MDEADGGSKMEGWGGGTHSASRWVSSGGCRRRVELSWNRGIVKKGRTGVMDPLRQHLGLQQRVQTTGGTVTETGGGGGGGGGDEDGKKGCNEPVPPTASFPTEGAEDR